MAAIERLSMSRGKYSPPEGGGYVMDSVHVGSPASQKVQQGTANRVRRPQRCRCRTVGTARRWQPLSILRITQTFRTEHFSYCPDYRSSEQSLEITMQIVPPSWLLYHTIDFGTHVRNWSTMSPFSISPMVVGTSRLVDSKTSPAFRAIKDTIQQVDRLHWHTSGSGLIPQLQSSLQQLLENGEASIFDADSNGRTILNVGICSFVKETHANKRWIGSCSIVRL